MQRNQDRGGAAAESLRAGLVVGARYRLDGPLGQGAMGSVWAATHLGLGEPVAIKFIDAKVAASPETRRRFETEARATAKIRSRFVVSVFDNGRLADGTLYLVMERLQGETLHAYAKRRGALSLAESVEYACHVGRALGRAHERGVIHRDVKPSNVFLADTPDDGRVAKVLDFGVAKLLQPLEGVAAGQTSAGALLGTPQYMSPEQARGQGGVDHRTDVYSLGLVFFRMYAGKPPRPAAPVGDVIARILTSPLPKLSAARPDAPPALAAWFERACADDPAARFESAEACVEALVEAAGLRGAAVADGLARNSVALAAADERPSAAFSTLTPAGVSSDVAAPSLGRAGGDDAFVAGGSLPTPRRPFDSVGVKGWRAARGWTLGALSLAAIVVVLGATLSRTVGRGGAAAAVGVRVNAAMPPGGDDGRGPVGAREAPRAGDVGAPAAGASGVAPAPGAGGAPADAAAAPARPGAPTATPGLAPVAPPKHGRAGKARGAGAGAALPAGAPARAGAEPASAPRDAIDLGY